MRISFDIDGVLADYSKAFVDLLRVALGVGPFGEEHPLTRYVPQRYDFSDAPVDHALVERLQRQVRQSPTWWATMRPLFGADVAQRLRLLAQEHTIWFTSARPTSTQALTEGWIRTYIGIEKPDVVVASDKRHDLRRADLHIDDDPLVIADLPEHVGVLLLRPYNAPVPGRAFVASLREFIDLIHRRSQQ
jgi:uncharacterized HAD superfamily protein